jgi:group I intron endonuclease
MAAKHPITAFCGVYAIVNLENGRAYVGSAVNVRQRWANHRYSLRTGRANPGLLADWRAQGGRGFLFTVLRSCDERDLVTAERDAMAQYVGSLYNRVRAGRFAGRVGLGKAKTASHKAAIAAALAGKPKTPDAIERMRVALTGRTCGPRSDETKRRLSVANAGQVPWIKGHAQSIEHRARIDAKRQRYFYGLKDKPWPDLPL